MALIAFRPSYKQEITFSLNQESQNGNVVDL